MAQKLKIYGLLAVLAILAYVVYANYFSRASVQGTSGRNRRRYKICSRSMFRSRSSGSICSPDFRSPNIPAPIGMFLLPSRHRRPSRWASKMRRPHLSGLKFRLRRLRFRCPANSLAMPPRVAPPSASRFSRMATTFSCWPKGDTFLGNLRMIHVGDNSVDVQEVSSGRHATSRWSSPLPVRINKCACSAGVHDWPHANSPGSRAVAPQESGFALLLVLFMMLLLLIASTAAVSDLRTEKRRQREEEMVWRGNQYVRAIRLYYHKTGHYPQNLDDLQKGLPDLHFLRYATYKDPLNTNGGEWRFIYVNSAGQIIGSVKYASLQQMALMDLNGGQLPGASSALPEHCPCRRSLRLQMRQPRF